MKTNNILIIGVIIAAFFWLKNRNKQPAAKASKTIAPKPVTPPTVKPTPAPVKPPVIISEEEVKPGIISKEDEKVTPIFSTASAAITATAQAPAPALSTQNKKEFFGAQPNISKLQELAKLEEMQAAAIAAPPATIVETILEIITPKPRITLSKQIATKSAASATSYARFSGRQNRWKK